MCAAYKCNPANRWGLATWPAFRCVRVSRSMILLNCNRASLSDKRRDESGLSVKHGQFVFCSSDRVRYPARRCNYATGWSPSPPGAKEDIDLTFWYKMDWRGQSYKESVVQQEGYKILSRSESVDDESDRISFCRVFRDLLCFESRSLHWIALFFFAE